MMGCKWHSVSLFFIQSIFFIQSVHAASSFVRSDDLIQATIKEDIDLIYSKLRNGAEVDGVSRTGHNTSLLIAAQKGNIKAVRALLKYGADINHTNRRGNSALMLAAKGGHLKLVRILLNYSPNIQFTNRDGKTALDLAYENEHHDIVSVLDQARERLRRPTLKKVAAIRTLDHILPLELTHMIIYCSLEVEEGHWIYEMDAKEGDPEAQFQLANCYFSGQGVIKNAEKGIKYLKQAAKRGHSEAQFQLGKMYQKGKLVKMDQETAVYWFEQAARRGDIQAIKELIDVR